MSGTVYLLHFARPLPRNRGSVEAPVQHYLGWAQDVGRRLSHHAGGRGSRLMAAVSERGIAWTVARTWRGDRALEARLKRRHGHRKLCPLCRPAARHRATAAGCSSCSGLRCQHCARHLYRRRDGVLGHCRRAGCDALPASARRWQLA